MSTTAKINEQAKVDVGLAPVSLATTNATGEYHSMSGYKRALFYFTGAVMAATKTIVAQVMEAKDGIATSAQALTSAAATITANVKSTVGLITANTIADSATVVTVTIYNLAGTLVSTQIYTCEDSTPVAANGEFASGANDAAACVNLAAVINALQGDYLYAVAGATPDVVTLYIREPGSYTVSSVSADGTAVISTLKACGYVEIDASQLTALYTHVAIKLTTSATIVVGATLVREGLTCGQHRPGQAVAALKVL